MMLSRIPPQGNACANQSAVKSKSGHREEGRGVFQKGIPVLKRIK